MQRLSFSTPEGTAAVRNEAAHQADCAASYRYPRHRTSLTSKEDLKDQSAV